MVDVRFDDGDKRSNVPYEVRNTWLATRQDVKHTHRIAARCHMQDYKMVPQLLFHYDRGGWHALTPWTASLKKAF